MYKRIYKCIYKPCRLTFRIDGLPNLKAKTLCCPSCQSEVIEVKK